MREENIVLLSYSLSVVHDLESNKLLKSFIDISLKNKVLVRWIPAHTSLENDKADKLIKQCSRMQHPNVPTSYKKVKSIIKQEHVEFWRNIHYYTRASDATNKLERRSPTTIFPL